MERPLEDTTHLFIGKTIQKMDASCCNKVEFLFTDQTKVALHIDCDSLGLPQVDTCTSCVEIEGEPVDNSTLRLAKKLYDIGFNGPRHGGIPTITGNLMCEAAEKICELAGLPPLGVRLDG